MISSNGPLRIGIGIHYGEAIVGAMGPPRSQIITAIGDTVNTCARLESLTKDYDCVAIVSQQAAALAGLDVAGHELLQASVKGRSEPVQFYALKTLARVLGGSTSIRTEGRSRRRKSWRMPTAIGARPTADD